MTFKTFEAIAAEHRPDVVVHADKTFGGVPDIAVYFKRTDGTHSKVYSYRGSYQQVLNRLGIKVVSKSDIHNIKYQIELLNARNGKPNLFTKRIINNSTEIARLQAQLEEMNSGEYIIVDD